MLARNATFRGVDDDATSAVADVGGDKAAAIVVGKLRATSTNSSRAPTTAKTVVRLLLLPLLQEKLFLLLRGRCIAERSQHQREHQKVYSSTRMYLHGFVVCLCRQIELGVP